MLESVKLVGKYQQVDSMTREEALRLLEKVGLPQHTIEHSIAVAEKALDIARQIQDAGHAVNLEVVEIGALLHDIGRVKAHGVHHAAAGGQILRDEGYDEAIARIAETHSLNASWPETIEEKIVCYADKIVKGTQEISIKDRFDIWIRRYGHSQLLAEAEKVVMAIEEELLSLITQ